MIHMKLIFVSVWEWWKFHYRNKRPFAIWRFVWMKASYLEFYGQPYSMQPLLCYKLLSYCKRVLTRQSSHDKPPFRKKQMETWIWSLGWEDPLEEGMATHSTILAWRIPWTEEPGRLQFTGSQKIGHNWETNKKKREWEKKPTSSTGDGSEESEKKEFSDWKQKVCLNVKAEYQI